MADPNSPFHISVADLLARHPETMTVFMRHRMACVGCDIAVFETVPEAAAIYRLDREEFAAELARAIQTAIKEKSG